MSSTGYHSPVLLHDAITGLSLKPDGVYVDATHGGGGHSRAILTHLTTGKLVAFDQDDDARQNLPKDEKLHFIPQNFRYLRNNLKMLGVIPVNGILADLGVSSHQFDTAQRGFSTRFDGPLDMRMDVNSTKTALDIIQNYEEHDLKKVLWNYGELKQSGKVARAIKSTSDKIKTTEDLKQALTGIFPREKENSHLARVFQALRIEVNDELGALREFLEQCADVLLPGGRLVVISYHSLEDRLVKNYMKRGKFEGEVEKDFYGNEIKPFKALGSKPIIPQQKEIETNKRARSAKLRIAERTDV